MFTGVFFILVTLFVGAFAYKQSRLEKKLIKDISVIDWLGITVYPLLIYVGFLLFIRSILARPRIEMLDYDDFAIFSVGTPFLIYAFVGNSMHFVSKSLSRHMAKNQQSMVFRINEIFHGKLSHYLTLMNAALSLFMLVLLEVNHPLPIGVNTRESLYMTMAGVLLGIPIARSIFYTSDWFRGNRSMFVFVAVLFLSIASLFYVQELPYGQYPVGAFVLSLCGSVVFLFVLRRILVQFHLTQKKRFRFIAKIIFA